MPWPAKQQTNPARCCVAQGSLQEPQAPYTPVTNLVLHYNSTGGVLSGAINDLNVSDPIGADLRTNMDLPEQVRLPLACALPQLQTKSVYPCPCPCRDCDVVAEPSHNSQPLDPTLRYICSIARLQDCCEQLAWCCEAPFVFRSLALVLRHTVFCVSQRGAPT